MAVTRFAPSPNGPLHLGHAWSAVIAHDLARARGGRFLLRIEDIDGARSRPALAAEFRQDLAWLGLEWEEVPAQSRRVASYAAAVERLREMGLLYPCRCTRAEIAAATAELGGAGSQARGETRYPGTCRGLRLDPAHGLVAWRLDVAAAIERTGALTWHDEIAGEQRVREGDLEDVVLVRKEAETPASYHLAVTIDDAADGVTLVTRGADLFFATPVHRLLQALLELPVPIWHHHPLLVDPQGRKLAKRRDAGIGVLGLTHRRLAGDDGRALAAALRQQRFPAGISLAKRLDVEP
jgi:glutamyl-Q tRNA(Asp) synthetase